MSDEGGYLLPHYIYKDKPGIKAWLLRYLGKRFRCNAWYNKGVTEIDLYAALLKPYAQTFVNVRLRKETEK